MNACQIVLLVALIAVVTLAIVKRDEFTVVLGNFLNWMKDHPRKGPIYLCLVYIACTLAFVPGSILTIGSGVILKQVFESIWKAILVGTAAIWIGASIG